MKRRADLSVTGTWADSDEKVVAPPPRPMLGADALEAFLRARRPPGPILTIDGLDGYLAAIIIGPKFIDPRIWLGRLVGEHALVAGADTEDHLAAQAVADHHNRISRTLSEHPDRYRPMFTPHRDGGVDPLFWWLGFTSGIELAPRPWKKITDPRRPGRVLFDPIYDATSRCDPAPDGITATVAKAVVAIREYFMPQRIRSSR